MGVKRFFSAIFICISFFAPGILSAEFIPTIEVPGLEPESEVYLSKDALSVISSILTGALEGVRAKGEEGGKASLEELLKGVKEIRLLSYKPLDVETMASMAKRLDDIGSKLAGQGWISPIRIRQERKVVSLYMLLDKEIFKGLFLFLADDQDTTILTISSSVSISALSALPRLLESGRDLGLGKAVDGIVGRIFGGPSAAAPLALRQGQAPRIQFQGGPPPFMGGQPGGPPPFMIGQPQAVPQGGNPLVKRGRVELVEADGGKFMMVDLSDLYNRPHNSLLVGGGDNASFATWFSEDVVRYKGVPFMVKRRGKDVLVSENNTENRFVLEGVDCVASKIHLLVWGYNNPPPTMPLVIRYEDGTSETVRFRTYEWTRGEGDVAFNFQNTVPLFQKAAITYDFIELGGKGKRIKEVESRGSTFGLVAITFEK
jgi:hypothetical protein